MKLTAAEVETLRRVLRAGGAAGLTMGSLKKRPSYIRKTTARRMIEKGLLEGRPGAWFAGSYRPDGQNLPEGSHGLRDNGRVRRAQRVRCRARGGGLTAGRSEGSQKVAILLDMTLGKR